MTYAVLSDLHCHNWSTFASIDADGVNSRLRIILNEWERAADELAKTGGNVMVISGDIFHVRGSVSPEVLNPVQKTVKTVLDMGIDILAIPGNHDLAGKETTELGSSIQTLSETSSRHGSFRVFNEVAREDVGHKLGFVPWRSNNAALLEDLDALRQIGGYDEADIFIHAGIDGVLPGMPDHGLSDKKLAAFGFRHVFAGHFHNRKILQGGVVSVGATTHQTWGDIGTQAGFLLVENDGSIKVFDSHAPKFIDVTGLDEEDMRLLADGNYVRFRGGQMSTKDVADFKHFLTVDCSALGVSIQVTKTQVNARGASTSTGKTVTLDQSVAGFIDQSNDIPAHVAKADVKKGAQDVLNAARAVVEEA